MSENKFATEQDERGVARLTLDRPEVHNAFDDGLIAGLTKELNRLGDDPSVRIVVLAANGKSFSAGADLNWMKRMAGYGREENVADSQALAGLMQTLSDLPRPVVGLVQGAAFGGGVGLVACCDIAIASDGALFSLSEVWLGLIPAVISPYVVRAIGERMARRYFLTAERFDAKEAMRMGLVHRVVPREVLDDAGEEMVAELLAGGPAAQAASKVLIRRVASGAVDREMIDYTANAIADIRASEEGKEGVSAFLEKRKPNWK